MSNAHGADDLVTFELGMPCWTVEEPRIVVETPDVEEIDVLTDFVLGEPDPDCTDCNGTGLVERVRPSWAAEGEAHVCPCTGAHCLA